MLSKEEIKSYAESLIAEVNTANVNRTTVCVIETTCGFNVVGESHCVNKEQFSEEVGKERAYEKALEKLIDYVVFLLKFKDGGDWKYRLIAEKDELKVKHDRLKSYLNTEASKSNPHYQLLTEQLPLMSQYLDILEKRLSLTEDKEK